MLEDPVEDSKGFVYNRKDVEKYIRRPGFNGRAPIAGPSTAS